MKINTECKITIKKEVYFEKGIVKTHSCDIGEWWGEDRCKEISFDEVIKEIDMPEGDYLVTISFDKV